MLGQNRRFSQGNTNNRVSHKVLGWVTIIKSISALEVAFCAATDPVKKTAATVGIFFSSPVTFSASFSFCEEYFALTWRMSQSLASLTVSG